MRDRSPPGPVRTSKFVQELFELLELRILALQDQVAYCTKIEKTHDHAYQIPTPISVPILVRITIEVKKKWVNVHCGDRCIDRQNHSTHRRADQLENTPP